MKTPEIDQIIDCLNRARWILRSVLTRDMDSVDFKGMSELITNIQDIKINEFAKEVDTLKKLKQNIGKLVEQLCK